jgi:Undecaprenyl-phosphate glucose phosphotransferase
MPLKARVRNELKSEVIQPPPIPHFPGRKSSAEPKRLGAIRTRIMAVEFAAVFGSAFLASFLYHEAGLAEAPPVMQYIRMALVIATLFSLVSAGFQHFSTIQVRPLHVILWNGVGAVGLAFSLLLSILFLFKIAEYYSRGTFFIQVICVSLAVISVRTIAYSWIRSSIASGTIQARHVILIGDATRCTQFSERLRASAIQSVATFRLPWLKGVKTGYDSKSPADENVQSLVAACRAIGADDIVLLTAQDELPKTMSLASYFSELPVGLHIVPVDALDLLAGSHIAEFGNLLTIQVHRPPLSPFDLAIKRSFDICAAAVGLFVLSPLFLIISIAIRLDSPGPAFFRQIRHGFNNEPIQILKFRTMTTLEDGDQFTQAVRDDPRVTRLGRILRQTNLDELPQFINVLQGKMSIVGPRPHATAHNELFQSKISPFLRRHTVKPGLTGWAQVNGFRGETDTLEKMRQRVEHDLYYIDNWSFLFDIKIILLTVLSKRAYTNAI